MFLQCGCFNIFLFAVTIYHRPNQAGQYGPLALKDGDPGQVGSAMESVLSLDDGRWLQPAEGSCHPLITEAKEDPFQFVSIKQPLPPPVLAQVQQDFTPIPPSRVADPRPGPAKPSEDGMPNTNSYQQLHVVCLLYQILVLPYYLLEFNNHQILVFLLIYI